MAIQSNITIYDDAGALQASHALPLPTAYGLILRTFQIVVRGGHEIAFYSGVTDGTPQDDDGSATIFAFDLTDGTPLANLDTRTRYTAGAYQQVDSLTALTDGSIVACWSTYESFFDGSGVSQQTIRVYDPSDTLVLEYALPAASVVGFGWCADAINPSSVYVSGPSREAGTWAMRQIEVTGSGSVVREVFIDRPLATVTEVPFFLTGLDRFAVQRDPAPGPFTGEAPIRWLRRTPHSISQLHRLFFGRSELLLDVGQGGTGATVTQRYSNDGGQTWGDGITRSTGAIGATTTRVFWPVNGSGRDRVWEWYGQGDAPIKLVDCFVQAREGIS